MEVADTYVGSWGLVSEGFRLLAEDHRKDWVLGDRCREWGASHLALAYSLGNLVQGLGSVGL